MKKTTYSLPGNPEKIRSNINAATKIYSSAEYLANITVTGVDPNTGNIFTAVIIMDENDAEFKTMINDYAARMLAEKIKEGL